MSRHVVTGARTECRCESPIAYQDPGERAACLKCGHWLASKLQSAGLNGETSTLDLPGDVSAPGAADPGPFPVPSQARPRGDDERSSPAVASGRGSGSAFHWPFPLEGSLGKVGDS